jgi:lysophospholipase L1-like esterase
MFFFIFSTFLKRYLLCGMCSIAAVLTLHINFRAALMAVIFCALVVVSGCGKDMSFSIVPGISAPVSAATPSIWVGAWGTSPTNAAMSTSNPGGSEQSFRFLVHPTIGGTEERVRFSNFFGLTPITIGASRLSIGQDSTAAVDASHDVTLTFNGASGVTIQPGQIVVSDPVQLTYSFGETLAVSVYLPGGFEALTQHDSLFPNGFATALGAGDKTSDMSGTSFTATTSEWFLLNGIDVFGPYQGTVVLFGTSTTEGVHSNYGNSNTYPTPNMPVAGQYASRPSDWLAKRLNAAGYQIGVINEGISGDTVTQSPTNATNPIQDAVERINRDVIQQPNVIAVVTYFGAIDLRESSCMSAPAIETATQQMIALAAAAKIRVLLATLPPSAFCTNPAAANYGPSPSAGDPYGGGSNPGPVNPAEIQRKAFNSWVRSIGVGLPGVVGIADYEATLADPTNLDFLLPGFNSGDNYHLNGAGYQAEAGVIPINLLLPPQ